MKVFECGCGYPEYTLDDGRPEKIVVSGVAICAFCSASLEDGGGDGVYTLSHWWVELESESIVLKAKTPEATTDNVIQFPLTKRERREARKAQARARRERSLQARRRTEEVRGEVHAM